MCIVGWRPRHSLRNGYMTISTFASNGQQYPTLRFGVFPWWTRLYYGVRFLPRAFRAIRDRTLTPVYSFHLLTAQCSPIGISAGDIRYPGTPGDLRRLQPSVVYLEDRRFFSHNGIDLRAITRASIANLRVARIVQGGSTITQQLVRNTLLFPERSILRKVFEVLLSLNLERHYSKNEILDLYCNHVYLGRGIRGFAAAAKIIFRRNLSALDNTQICGLLGLLRTPTRSFPYDQGAEFLARQRKIAEILHLPRSDAHQLTSHPNPIDISRHRRPRFTQIVKSELARLNLIGCNDLRRIGLTLDNSVQYALSAALREITNKSEVRHAAGIVVSTSTADVLGEAAYQAGIDAESSPAYFGKVQPGSTFKTFALLSALQQGISLDQPLQSEPFESCCYRTAQNTPWRVRNYANTYRGLITLYDAFKYSDNTAFARLAEMLDTRHLLALFASFGLAADSSGTPAIVLGAHKGGVSLLSLVAAYRAIANGGSYLRPRIVQYAEFGDGSLQWFPRSVETRVTQGYQALKDLRLALDHAAPALGQSTIRISGPRSAARRVGPACRSRWSPYH